jgi:hypothetical protein
MQAIPNPPKPPDAPLPPTSVTTVAADGKIQTLAIPQTADEVAALRARRDELSSQLNSVTDRRSELVEQVKTAPEGTARTGLEDRIHLLDQRLLNLESDIAGIGRQLAATAPNLLHYTEEHPPSGSTSGDDMEEGVMVGGGAVLLAVSAFSAFRRWRRGRNRPSTETPRAIAADSARLERLEQGVEAIAIEVERISEGQRFVTRLLSESNPQQVPAQTIKG